MNIFERIRRSVKFRLERKRLFVGAQTQTGSTTLRIRCKELSVTWPESEHAVHGHELYKIFFEDCYRLETEALKNSLSVVDIGANIGLFTLAAARQFPNATIHCYEPNPEIQKHLVKNVEPLGIRCFGQAVGFESGQVSLSHDENSLHTRMSRDSRGEIEVTSFSEVVSRIGEKIDMLKLDCEGAEWEILTDQKAMSRVSFLTMEYHLWARPNSTLGEFLTLCTAAGFPNMEVIPSVCGQFGMAYGWNQTCIARK